MGIDTMTVAPPASEAVSMIEVLISYQLPESLAEPELRSWLADQMQALSAEAVAFLPPERSADHDHDRLARFALDSDAARSTEVALPTSSPTCECSAYGPRQSRCTTPHGGPRRQPGWLPAVEAQPYRRRAMPDGGHVR
jgi:hypothetical protein